MDNVTNKTLVVLKNHQSGEREITTVDYSDVINIANVFCEWVGERHSELGKKFRTELLDFWIMDMMNHAFRKFEHLYEFSDYEEKLVSSLGRVGISTEKLNTVDGDTYYNVVLSIQKLSTGKIQEFSMVFYSVSKIKSVY